MGFRSGAYATVWDIEDRAPAITRGRISISRKRKDTGEYETDFSGFVDFLGTGAATKALGLKERDRIKLGDVDVSTFYNKETKVNYTNFKIFSFELLDEDRNPEPGEESEDLFTMTEDAEDGETPW